MSTLGTAGTGDPAPGETNPGTGDPAPGQAAPGAGDVNAWLSGIGEPGQAYIAKNGYTNIDDALKAGERAQSLVGLDKGQVLKMPVGDPDPENAEWQAMWNANGRPEKSDGYTEFQKVEGVPELSPDQLSTVQTDMHSLGMTDRQVQGVMALYGKMGLETEAASSSAGDDALEAATASMKTEFGGKYEENMNAVGALIDQYGGKDVRDFFNDSAAGNDPRFVNFLLNITQNISEPGALKGHGNQSGETTVAAAEASLAKLKTDHREALQTKSHNNHGWAVKERLRLQKIITPSE